MMKHLKKRMILLSIICICCFGATALLRFWYPGQGQETKELYMLTGYEDYRQILVAKIVRGEETITLGNVNGETLIVGEENTIPANQPAILKFFQSIPMLTLEGKMKEASSAELAEYGLVEPSAVVTLADINDGGVCFSIGNVTPDSKYYYCSVSDSSVVYLMAEETAEIFLQQFDNFYDLSFYPSLEGEQIRLLTDISVETEEGTAYRLTRRKASQTANLVYFDMVSPIQFRVGREQVEKTLLTSLQSLKGSELVEENPADLSAYGLEEARRVLELHVDGRIYRVRFGDSTEDGVYAMTENGTLVVKVKADLLQFLDYGYLDICGSSLLEYNIHEVSKMCLESGAEVWEYSIAADGNEVSVTLAGEALEEQKFLNLFEKINALPTGGAYEGSLGERLMKLEYFLTEEEGTQVYEFYEIGDRKCAVAVNGTVLFWCYESAAEEILGLAEELQEAEQQ